MSKMTRVRIPGPCGLERLLDGCPAMRSLVEGLSVRRLFGSGSREKLARCDQETRRSGARGLVSLRLVCSEASARIATPRIGGLGTARSDVGPSAPGSLRKRLGPRADRKGREAGHLRSGRRLPKGRPGCVPGDSVVSSGRPRCRHPALVSCPTGPCRFAERRVSEGLGELRRSRAHHTAGTTQEVRRVAAVHLQRAVVPRCHSAVP